MPYRAQTVAYQLLEKFLEYAKGVASGLVLKAEGKEYAAKTYFNDFRIEFGRHELAIERYYDQNMCISSLKRIFDVISDRTSDAEEQVYQQS